jgi:hypothetical protein
MRRAISYRGNKRRKSHNWKSLLPNKSLPRRNNLTGPFTFIAPKNCDRNSPNYGAKRIKGNFYKRDMSEIFGKQPMPVSVKHQRIEPDSPVTRMSLNRYILGFRP